MLKLLVGAAIGWTAARWLSGLPIIPGFQLVQTGPIDVRTGQRMLPQQQPQQVPTTKMPTGNPQFPSWARFTN